MTLFFEYSIVYNRRQLGLGETLSLGSYALVESAASPPVMFNDVSTHLGGNLGPTPLDCTPQLVFGGGFLEADLVNHKTPYEFIEPVQVW